VVGSSCTRAPVTTTNCTLQTGHSFHVFIARFDFRYDGLWKNDKRSGQGIYRYGNGDVYTGEWLGDVRHGRGTYSYDGDRIKYVGMWRHGKRSGIYYR